MLDPWIIEEIRRREEQQRQREQQPAVIELPVDHPEGPEGRGERERVRHDRDEAPRGIAIIEI